MRALLSVIVLVVMGIAPASAQTWPTHPIKLITPVNAGIATDVIARLLSDYLSRSLAQQVYVDNMPGAAGTIGTEAAAHSSPDGYVFLFATAGMLSTNKYLFKSLPFDLDRDFTAVSIVCMGTPFVVSANMMLPVKSIPDLIALAKSEPGELSYATDISSSLAPIIGELLTRRAGIKMVQVPYRSTAQAIQDTIAGTTDLIIGAALSTEGFAKAGKLRRIGIATAQPFAGMEDVRPIAETLPGFDFEGWFAVVAPAGTPTEIVTRLSREIDLFLKDPVVAERLREFTCIPHTGGTPASAAAFLQSDRESWARIAKDIDLKPQ